jgi:hypothetical protein
VIRNPGERTLRSLAISGVGRSLLGAARAYSREPGMPRVGATLAVTVSSPSPSPSVPPDLAAYSFDERAAYVASVAALRRFSTVNDRFSAQGKLTKQQARFYRRYSIDWVGNWASQAQLVDNKITVTGEVREVWIRPVDIDLTAGRSQTVVLRRCLDQTQVRVFADRRPVPQPQLRVPHVYRLSMVKRPTEDWWRTGLPKQGDRC